MALKFTIIIFAIFTLVLISSPVNQQQTSRAASVKTVPNDFPTIQAAINAPKSGDTIDVLSGTYVEQLTVPKDLTIVGAGSKSTFLRAPDALQQNAAGRPYIVDVNNKAKLSLKGFSIRGPDGTECDRLVAISVLGSAVLSFESSVIRGCIARGVQIGTAIGSHPQYGVATITKIDLVGYRDVGIFAIGKGSAITGT